jgi:transposase
MDHTIAVTGREMKRYELLTQVLKGTVSLAAATPALGVSYRHAKRLKREAAAGLAALTHGNRGRVPANRLDQGLRQRVLTLSQQRYGDFNDTHFNEMLQQHEEIRVSRETVRRWRRAAGIAPKRRHRAPAHRRRRERKPAAGMMMLWDGSPHHWFGPEHAPCCVMAAIDDATGTLLGLVFVPRESSWGYLKLLQQVLEHHGVPHSVYQDRHSALKRNDDSWTLDEELAGRQDPTQVGAALEALTITPIFALSPQAKGRAERLFETLQDRLVALLRLQGITAIDPANAYVCGATRRSGDAAAPHPGFIDHFNQCFAVAPQCAHSLWRKPPPPTALERILALSYVATVCNDNTVHLGGVVIDIPPGPHGISYARARVAVRQLLDGSWRVYYQQRLIASAPATEIADLIRTKRRRKGVPAAHDAAWVFAASAPGVPGAEHIARPHRPPPPDAQLGQRTPSSLRPGPVRRAGPGRTIKGTRIA